MKNIVLSNRLNKDWSAQWMREDNYDTLVKENSRIYFNDQLLAVVLKKAFTAEEFNKFISVMKTENWNTNNRGIAAGSGYIKKVKQDGSVSKTNRGASVNSGMFGFYERTPRFPYCRACAWNMYNPEKYSAVLPTLQGVSELFKYNVYDKWLYQKEFVSRTNPDFVIDQTVFTTITVNKNFRTAAHKDAGDLENGFSAMTVGSEGLWAGANLVFPDFRVAVELGHGDLILFQPHEFHGNTPLLPMSKNAARWSFVHYYRTNIQHCLSMEEELKRVKARKAGDHLK